MALRCLLAVFVFVVALAAQDTRGYYRFPAIHGSTIVFTAEGDLWQVGVEGGVARRLTTHLSAERGASFSPDGKTIAFVANYEGPSEVYTMPATGGLPTRRTFWGNASVAGWTPDSKLLVLTNRFGNLFDPQMVVLAADNTVTRVPLAQASAGAYDASGKTLFFTRLPFQGSHAKRYQGGTAQKLWKFTSGSEAVPLTNDYAGTSKDPMWWNGRVYLLSDRDGAMNLWSMDEAGKNLRQHTKHQGWDAKSPSLSQGKIAYQLGADLHLFDIASGSDKALNIELASDFDHLRERWVKNPGEFGVNARISWDGSKVILISRGKVFVAPAKEGRFVENTARKASRFRDAVMMPDGKNLLALSTESGEVELWRIPANGIGPGEQLTKDSTVLRWNAQPSPDGKWVTHQDKDNQLWLLEVATKTQKKIATSTFGHNSFPAFNVRWSPDSKWVAYSMTAANQFERIFLYSVDTAVSTPLTTDRYNSVDPAWSGDGKWMYFLSDRALRSTVMSPWGPRAPEPHFDKSMKIYQVSLKKGLRSPFQPADELSDEKKPEEKKPEAAKPDEKKPEGAKPEAAKPEAAKVEIDFEGLPSRLSEVPVPAGNYRQLNAVGKRLCWIEYDSADFSKTNLQCVNIANKGEKPETLMEGAGGYQVSGDGKKMMVTKQNDIFIFDSGIGEGAAKAPKTLADSKVDLKDWAFSVIPSDEFKEMFVDAWRLHRDYFYDRKMHGVDWKGARDKYAPLASRVRDREELNDLIAQMVSELSALHHSVGGGDLRRGQDNIAIGALGARLVRDPAAGGYVVDHIYKHDPDRPDKRSPLAQPGVELNVGDVILNIDGRETLAAADIGELLRNRVNKQVLLRVKPAGKTEPKEVVAKTISLQQESDLRYHEWEYTRRLQVEEASGGQIGYLHLRAMGPNDIAQFAEHYYPVHDRAGLIIDVRHNGGGNIDSWLLNRLVRKAWFYWQGRMGQPTWNMHYAFRGHIVVLCNEWTGSDGEAFAEGIKRLGIGKVIGTRTWGGEIWLTGSNRLADQGIASAAEIGVFGPDGKWLIEGHGVDPDIVVDNLPHETFKGRDAQLEAAISFLKGEIKEKPLYKPVSPPYPDKTFKAPATGLKKK
ncbi:MAG: S41 family peptidase [Bryobacteraceae bacterium]|nr:S41 family peptidase [Bryobacteraceae bacterium]